MINSGRFLQTSEQEQLLKSGPKGVLNCTCAVLTTARKKSQKKRKTTWQWLRNSRTWFPWRSVSMMLRESAQIMVYESTRTFYLFLLQFDPTFVGIFLRLGYKVSTTTSFQRYCLYSQTPVHMCSCWWRSLCKVMKAIMKLIKEKLGKKEKKGFYLLFPVIAESFQLLFF